ncbi:hypothetical protein BDZ85DRAFT_279110 [Elsinoe ampelina]|uniref:Uncharacterized protein n=1 Tax=Elsinoe ampelina TaxID=302913 RepID=A0A6A6GIX0_9PEZI|nr:hypothetical protein BDZ85DRAFT_279110 [Elsinoe ampelina]
MAFLSALNVLERSTPSGPANFAADEPSSDTGHNGLEHSDQSSASEPSSDTERNGLEHSDQPSASSMQPTSDSSHDTINQSKDGTTTNGVVTQSAQDLDTIRVGAGSSNVETVSDHIRPAKVARTSIPTKRSKRCKRSESPLRTARHQQVGGVQFLHPHTSEQAFP